MKTKALFLDRDGVINIDKHYVYKIKDFEFVENIFEICKAAKQNNYLIIVVTNQGGIAKGYYSENDFHILNNWMLSKFAEKEVIIDKVYYCPHHKEGVIKAYKKECVNRKPKPGMFLKAQNDFNIDFSKSIMIGDKDIDIKAAQAVHIPKLFMINSDQGLFKKEYLLINNLLEVIKFL